MQQNLKLNLHGLVAILLILLMFGTAFALKWNINWWYFVIAAVFYSTAVLFLTSREWDVTFRLLLGCHFALMFLILGLFIHFPDRALTNLRAAFTLLSILIAVAVAILLLVLVPLVLSIVSDGVDSQVATLITGLVEFAIFCGVGILAALDVRSGYFIACVSGGLALPFLLLKGKSSINLHGIIGMILIILIFGIAFFYDWTISWWYFILAIALYSGAIIFLTLGEDSQEPASELFKLRLSCHLAFVFLMVGLALHFQNEAINVGFFVVSVTGGLVIPHLLFR